MALLHREAMAVLHHIGEIRMPMGGNCARALQSFSRLSLPSQPFLLDPYAKVGGGALLSENSTSTLRNRGTMGTAHCSWELIPDKGGKWEEIETPYGVRLG